MVDYVKSICKSTPSKIVDAFISNSLHGGLNISITTKNMIFLWKKYLEERYMPNIIFHEPLKQIFREKLTYDENTDSFLNITSPHLPVVSLFMEFWSETMTNDNGTTNDNMVLENEALPVHEYEIDEILILFKKWGKKPNLHLNETMINELISHFYPEIKIIENKYVSNIKCSLWDKSKTVLEALKAYTRSTITTSSAQVLSLYGAYEHYTQYALHPYIVSKKYFERVSRNAHGDLIDTYGIISADI